MYTVGPLNPTIISMEDPEATFSTKTVRNRKEGTSNFEKFLGGYPLWAG